MEMKVGIVKDEIFLEHEPPEYHPENPERLRAIYKIVDEIKNDDFLFLKPRAATDEEIALNHNPNYIDLIRQTSEKIFTRLDPDTYASSSSFEAAKKAVGGILDLIDMAMASKIKGGFALVRPPGHHAEASRAMGFCLFNNVAIGAWYLMRRYDVERILIVDFDLHHGNGTQRSFYDSRNVLYFSTHQYPYYPGTGSYEEIGTGNGKGYTVNVPLPGGMGNGDFIYVFNEILIPIAEQFRPQFILVSSGFDAHKDDPLGGMRLTEAGFAEIGRMLLNIAERHCPSRIVFSLEGGYNITALSESVKAVLMELVAKPLYYVEEELPSSQAKKQVERIKNLLTPFFEGI